MGEYQIHVDCKLFSGFGSREDIISKIPTSHPNVEEWLDAQETVEEDFVDLDKFINIDKDLANCDLRNTSP